MYKIRNFLLLVAHIYVSLVFRGKQVFVVTGLRRSGNHAFINWFASALEDQGVVFESDRVDASATGRTLLFNAANAWGLLAFIQDIRQATALLDASTFIIISLEDYIPSKRDPFVPRQAVKIAITRSTLNLIASRLQRSIFQAGEGLARGDMLIDKRAISAIEWLHDSDNYGYFVWTYDQWVLDRADYRKQFLKQFDLQYDAHVPMSTQADGSSFSGQQHVPSSDEATNRWNQVSWPERVIKLLIDYPSSKILTESEASFLRSKLSLIHSKNKSKSKFVPSA